MSVEDMAWVTAVLALLAGAAAVVVGVGVVAGQRFDPLERVTWWVRDRALAFGAVVAATSTAGSLYYSEVAGFVPCRYCWFQRIAMYPIVVVAGVAAWRRDGAARLTVGILATVGLAISTWHWLVQHNPSWATESSCDLTAPCTAIYVEKFGFVTIPWMAGSGFALIIALMVAATVLRDHEETAP